MTSGAPQSVNKLTAEQDRLALAVIRGLAMDAPLYAKSGHQGTAMALAPLAHVLYSRIMRHDPANPDWLDRDRFILSGGHASILQYSMLFLSGYGLELDDLKNFRQWNSSTPGHPEVGHTKGVEVTTGPLGQGFANAVGMAIVEANHRARFGEEVTSHFTYVVVGDGCLMEGISHEAASLAGHLGLDHLIAIFDDNKITIDGSTNLTCSDNVPQRFKSYGWNVIELGDVGDDLDAIESALEQAKNNQGKPTLITLSTHIGSPSPDFTDKHAAHGNPFTTEHVSRTKEIMGIPDEPFFAPHDLISSYRAHCSRRAEIFNNRTRSNDLEALWAKPHIDSQLLPLYDDGESVATRVAIQRAIETTSPQLPSLLVGAADLTGNTGAKDSSQSALSRSNHGGRQIYFGIREHAMGAIAVGMSLHGGAIPVIGTFFVFADYMRPAIRLAALSKAHCIFVFSHDSVGVGEDGPTHQPVEHLASLRAIPGLRVIRPADANETLFAWKTAIESEGPTALILSRQNVPVLSRGEAVITGGAVLSPATDADVTLIATGSEVHLATLAKKELHNLDIKASVVSLPSWDMYLLQSLAEREKVIPSATPSVSIEAASTFGWSQFSDAQIGIDRFGASAPGPEVMDKLGLNVANICKHVQELLNRKG